MTSNQNYYVNDWIVDSSYSNRMKDNKQKLQNLSEYNRSCVVVTTNYSKLLIAHISNSVVSP